MCELLSLEKYGKNLTRDHQNILQTLFKAYVQVFQS